MLKNQSKHSWASQVGGAKRQKRLSAAQAQQWYWKKNKKNKKNISASLVIPVLRLVSSLFLLLPTETNYFTRSLSSIFISRALQRWGERQMPRFSAWLSPLNRHPPPRILLLLLRAASGLFMLLSAVICFSFSLFSFFFSKRGQREAVWTHGELLHKEKRRGRGSKNAAAYLLVFLHYSSTRKPHHFNGAQVRQKLKSMMTNCSLTSGEQKKEKKKRDCVSAANAFSERHDEPRARRRLTHSDLTQMARLWAHDICVPVFMRGTSSG